MGKKLDWAACGFAQDYSVIMFEGTAARFTFWLFAFTVGMYKLIEMRQPTKSHIVLQAAFHHELTPPYTSLFSRSAIRGQKSSEQNAQKTHTKHVAKYFVKVYEVLK